MSTVNTHHDLTQKVDVLLNSHQLQQIVEMAPYGMALVALNGRFVYVNTAFCQLVQYSKRELLQMSVMQLSHECDRAAYVGLTQRLAKGQIAQFEREQRFFAKDQRQLNVLAKQVVVTQDSSNSVAASSSASTAQATAQATVKSTAQPEPLMLMQVVDMTAQHQAALVLHRQRDREQWLRNMMQQFQESLHLRPTLEAAVLDIGQFFQVDQVVVWQTRTSGQMAVLAEANPHPEHSLAGVALSPDLMPPSMMKTVQVVNDVRQCPRSATLQQLYPQLSAYITVPIWVESQLWGMLAVYQSADPRAWQETDVELLQQIAAQISLAVQQAELYQQIQHLNNDLERQVKLRTVQLELAYNFEATLKRITDKVRDSLDENQILQTVVEELVAAIGVQSCNASLYDLIAHTSTVQYESQGYPKNARQGRRADMEKFPELYNRLMQGESLQFCSLLPHAERGRVALLAIPIQSDQCVIGDIWLVNHSYYSFKDEDIRLVQQVANQCAIALRQAKLYQAAQSQVQELERLNQLKDDFLSTISHELRTPMTSIKMAIQMLQVAVQSHRSPAIVQQYLTILQDECQREIDLITDLLNFSQEDTAPAVDQADQAANPPLMLTAAITAPLNLASFIVEKVEPFRQRAQQQQFYINLPDQLPTVYLNAVYLERILTELVGNACKYTPAGEMITVAARVQAEQLQLQVSNSGVELATEELSHIFEKFYRIPRHDPWRYGGTGLGLAVVKQLVEHLGGHIEAVSGGNQLVFTVNLPLQHSTALPA